MTAEDATREEEGIQGTIKEDTGDRDGSPGEALREDPVSGRQAGTEGRSEARSEGGSEEGSEKGSDRGSAERVDAGSDSANLKEESQSATGTAPGTTPDTGAQIPGRTAIGSGTATGSATATTTTPDQAANSTPGTPGSSGDRSGSEDKSGSGATSRRRRRKAAGSPAPILAGGAGSGQFPDQKSAGSTSGRSGSPSSDQDPAALPGKDITATAGTFPASTAHLLVPGSDSMAREITGPVRETAPAQPDPADASSAPARDSAAPAAPREERHSYSTAYSLCRISVHTNEAIKYFRQKTFSVINNCLFNLCMVDPIHMEDQEYDELYDRLCGLFTDTENCLQGALDRLDAMLSAPGCQAPEMHYTAPLETELQIKTPLGLRYARILETLDRLLMKIDQALTAGIISNPRDAVKLKFQWTRKVFAFTGEIRSLDNRR